MTKVNWRLPLILAATLLCVFFFAVWLEHKHKPEKEAKTEREKKIFPALKETATSTIRIFDGSKTYGLKCLDPEKLCKAGDSSKWELTEPAKFRADGANSDSILSSLHNLSATETIDLKEETTEKRTALLKDYRLEASQRAAASVRRIEVTDAKGATTVLYVGEPHPMGDSMFAAVGKGEKPPYTVDETKVLLIPSYVKGHFDHDLTYWRDKKLFSLSQHEVKSFDYKGPKGEISAELKDGSWVVTTKSKSKGKAEEVPGDAENIGNLLAGLVYQSAKGFAADSKDSEAGRAALKGYAPGLTLTFKKESKDPKNPETPVTFTLYDKKGGKAYATVSNLDPVFEVEAGTLARFDKAPKDFRLMKVLTSLERFNIKKIEAEAPGIAKQSVSQSDGKWLLDPGRDEANSDRVVALLDKLSGNRVKEVLETPPDGESNGMTLTLQGDEKGLPKPKRLRIWKGEADALYARDLDSPRKEVFALDTAISAALPWSKDFFKRGAAPEPSATPPRSGK